MGTNKGLMFYQHLLLDLSWLKASLNTGEKVEITELQLTLHKGGGKVDVPLALQVLHDQKQESLEFPGSRIPMALHHHLLSTRSPYSRVQDWIRLPSLSQGKEGFAIPYSDQPWAQGHPASQCHPPFARNSWRAQHSGKDVLTRSFLILPGPSSTT